LYAALVKEQFEITIPAEIAEKAVKPIKRMLQIK
jgi:quinolinate synthase